MKKNFLFLLFASAAMLITTSCVHEEDDIFDASAAERLNAASEKYSQLLESSEGGWVVEYYPTNEDALTTGQGYLWMVKFGKDESCKVGMNNYFSNNAYRECTSLWEVITDNGPVLTFNSYNPNVHAFSDPDVRSIPGSGDNVWGTGVGGDYEFVIVDAPEDHSYVMLKGKKRGTYNRMTPLPAGVDYAEYLADINNFMDRTLSWQAPNNNYLKFADKRYVLATGQENYISMYPEDGDAITETTDHFFMVTKRNGDYYLRFRNAFDREGMEGTLQEMRYDSLAQEFVGVENDQFRIVGYEPGRFFGENIGEGNSWAMAKTAEMSPKFKEYIDELDTRFANTKDSRNRSYTFVGINLGRDARTIDGVRDTVNCCNIVYRTPGSSRNTSACYVMDMKNADESVTYQYLKPRDTSAANIQNTFDTITKLMTLFTREFVVSACDSKFNLTRVKLTAADDPDIWFIVTV